MAYQLLEVAVKGYHPGRIFDVQDGKLITVKGACYDMPRLERVVQLIKSHNWVEEMQFPPENLDMLDHLFRLVKGWNDSHSVLDRKVEMQMLKLYLAMSGYPVTDQEVELLYHKDYCNFTQILQAIKLFRVANLPLSPPVIKALLMLNIVGMDFLLIFAQPWIKDLDNPSDILILLNVIRNYLSARKEVLLSCLKSRIVGLDTFQRMGLLTSMADITNEECFNVFGRLPPVRVEETYAERVLAIASALLSERQEIAALIQKWNLPPELVLMARVIPYGTRGAAFELAHRLFSNHSIEEKRSLILMVHVIPPHKHEQFFTYVTPLRINQDISQHIAIFMEFLTLLPQESQDIFFQKMQQQSLFHRRIFFEQCGKIPADERKKFFQEYIDDLLIHDGKGWKFDLGEDMNGINLICNETI